MKKTKLIQPFFQFTLGTKIIFLLKKCRRNVHFWNICAYSTSNIMLRLHRVQTSNIVFRLQIKVQNKDTQFHTDKISP